MAAPIRTEMTDVRMDVFQLQTYANFINCICVDKYVVTIEHLCFHTTTLNDSESLAAVETAR